MIASKITGAQLMAAASRVGVAIDATALSNSGMRHRVKLYPIVPADALTPKGYRRKGERGNAPYQRTSASSYGFGRRVHAVCWHGFRDFFRACYEQAPDAVFYTAMDTWRGSADFEARFRQSGHRNIGSQMMPVMAAEACACPDSGYAG